MLKNQEKFKEILRAADIKATLPRVDFLIYLSKEKGPRTLGEIAEGLAGVMDSATVYRIIPVLVKVGIVREMSLGSGRTYYEFAGDDHHHIICTSCGDIEDVHTCEADEIASRVLADSSKFKSIDRHSLEFFGVCKKCSKK
jgi:Fe2+ or Zn2+ uptake regulation protein